MNEIENNKLKMRSDSAIAIVSISSAVAVITTGIFSAILVTELIHELQTGMELRDMKSSFGVPGNPYSVFPWLLVSLMVGSIGLTFFVLKKLEFSYRLNKYILGALTVGVVAVGSSILIISGASEPIVSKGPLRRLGTVSNYAKEGRVLGTIVEQTHDGFYITTRDNRTIKIVKLDSTRHIGPEDVIPGDNLGAVGKLLNSDTFHAESVMVNPPNGRIRFILESSEY